MATAKQNAAARRNIKKAGAAAKRKDHCAPAKIHANGARQTRSQSGAAEAAETLRLNSI
jgi:hypothetical protein